MRVCIIKVVLFTKDLKKEAWWVRGPGWMDMTVKLKNVRIRATCSCQTVWCWFGLWSNVLLYSREQMGYDIFDSFVHGTETEPSKERQVAICIKGGGPFCRLDADHSV